MYVYVYIHIYIYINICEHKVYVYLIICVTIHFSHAIHDQVFNFPYRSTVNNILIEHKST